MRTKIGWGINGVNTLTALESLKTLTLIDYKTSINPSHGSFIHGFTWSRYSRPSHETLVQSAFTAVAQTFWENDRVNPTLHEENQLGRLPLQQFWAYRNLDSNTVQQKVLQSCLLKELVTLDVIEVQRTTAQLQLTLGGFFVTCRLCEYLKLPKSKKRRTDILRICCME